MSCIEEDIELGDAERALLRAAARGDRASLVRAVERFYPVVVALGYYRLKDIDEAQRWADPVVRALFQSLLSGRLDADGFMRAALQGLGSSHSGDGARPEEAAEHGLHGATKLVRRRAAARAIAELPLRPLLALVLRYHARWQPQRMVGLVADNRVGVREALLNGHRAVLKALEGPVST